MSAVCIVEDHQMLVDTLTAELAHRGVAASAVNPGTVNPGARRSAHAAEPDPTLIDAVLATEPELVLLDLDLGPGRDGVTLVAPLTAAGVKVLLVTGTTNRVRVAAALEAGAIGYQPKSGGFDALLSATQRALTATGPLDPVQRAQLLVELREARLRRAEADAPLLKLTERERAALESLTQGVSVPQISTNWNVSEATVRTHVRGVLTKLGARTQLEAVATANQRRWFSRRRSSVRA